MFAEAQSTGLVRKKIIAKSLRFDFMSVLLAQKRIPKPMFLVFVKYNCLEGKISKQ